MSPSAFKQQVTQLISELTRCFELCDAIRANRRLGSTHEALDSLQYGLKESAHGIQLEFNALRKVIGSRMDLGDETARNSMNRAIREVQTSIQARLFDIAYRKRDRETHDPELPGFRDLLRKVERIEDTASDTLEDLGQRFESEKQEAAKPKPQPQPKKEAPKPKPKTDEAIISLKELDYLINHMKNSWVEKSVAGKSLYVNVFDDKKTQWEKPEGFIKALPRQPKPARTPTWEQQQPRRPVREEFWDSPTLASLNSTSPNNNRNELPLEIQQTNNEAYTANPTKKPGRRGHKKSRRGCFNCKRARIKCKENRPSCDYCAHRDLICEWPDVVRESQPQVRTVIRKAQSPVRAYAQIPMGIQHQIPVFNMQDFRLFNYFIEKAYPHHPIESDWIWTHDIPNIAADHDYLLHSMLALAGSELADKASNPSTQHQLACTAISHRVQAITSLNASLAQGITRVEQGNAMIATCFSLLFQSVLIDDGLAEYMSFIRGTVAVGMQMSIKGLTILFDKLFEDKEMEVLEPLLLKAPLLEPVLVKRALRSLERIEPLCQTRLEREIYGMLLSTTRALITSSRDGTYSPLPP
ncbi:hypothetical protein G7Y89_g7661 [Cudoniella acicularis]|uniref:Zn(2)-C6 fungal-type domain-containing protein n=1 Tax=Cudoniella acicularis TaxID=354080 RepID=A0A8H4W1U8_9HELO|nr:hypothetical protein G7Y89_g7661 [Cudoniella acicularis]